VQPFHIPMASEEFFPAVKDEEPWEGEQSSTAHLDRASSV